MRLVAVLLAALALPAHAAPLEEIVRAQLAPALPADTDIAKVHLPARLAARDVAPDDISVELPRELRVGRRSIKLSVRGERPVYVPVTIGAVADIAITERALPAGTVITEADVRIETRAIEGPPSLGASVIGARVTKALPAGSSIAATAIALPPPLPRGTQVTIEIRRGAVRVRGTGTLELVARPGEDATVRLAHTKQTLRGTLVAPATVVVKGTP